MTKATQVIITAPNIATAEIKIRGTAPLVQNKFSHKSAKKMLDAQMAGSTARSKKTREARDIEADYKGAMHLTSDGRYGVPAPAFRSAMISACRLVGFQMTKAKLSIFVDPDDFDAEDGSPLVYLDGEPEINQSHVRLESGVASIAIRPMWRKWSATVRVRFDEDQFTITDVYNLFSRAGIQVGIGEGRPDSKKSHGMGWGTFEIVDEEE